MYIRVLCILGKSRDGIITVFTKNGAYFVSQIMELNELEKRPYRNIRNIEYCNEGGKGKSGFYNPKK